MVAINLNFQINLFDSYISVKFKNRFKQGVASTETLKLNVEIFSSPKKNLKFITQIIQINIFKNLLGIIVTFISFYLSIYISVGV